MGVRHTLYLKMPKPLSAGKRYSLDLEALNAQASDKTQNFDPFAARSEAVHVNQIGYRPDDPVKQAFVSCWLGTGGVLALPLSMAFTIVDDASGKVVFNGKSERHFPADQPELMSRDANFNGTHCCQPDSVIRN